MYDFDSNLITRLNKIEADLNFPSRYLTDVNLVSTAIASKYLNLEEETTNALIRKVRKDVLDVYLATKEKER